jgi:hypothetical protein
VEKQEQGRAVLRCEGECLSSWIMDRRKGPPCTARKRKWHRALFSASRKRGKSDPLDPPNRAIGRCQRFQPGAILREAFHTHVCLPSLCERRPLRLRIRLRLRLSLSSPNANYQCRDAPGLGGPGTRAPACSPDVNWWLVQNMRCVHLQWSGQAICGARRRVCWR